MVSRGFSTAVILAIAAVSSLALVPAAHGATGVWPGHASFAKRPVFRPVTRATRPAADRWRPRALNPIQVGDGAAYQRPARLTASRPVPPAETRSAGVGRHERWAANARGIFRPDRRAPATRGGRAQGGAHDASTAYPALPGFRPLAAAKRPTYEQLRAASAPRGAAIGFWPAAHYGTSYAKAPGESSPVWRNWRR